MFGDKINPNADRIPDILIADDYSSGEEEKALLKRSLPSSAMSNSEDIIQEQVGVYDESSYVAPSEPITHGNDFSVSAKDKAVIGPAYAPDGTKLRSTRKAVSVNESDLDSAGMLPLSQLEKLS